MKHSHHPFAVAAFVAAAVLPLPLLAMRASSQDQSGGPVAIETLAPLPTSTTTPPVAHSAHTAPVAPTSSAPAPTPTTSVAVAPVVPGMDLAFCGPAYDAGQAEWQALAGLGVRLVAAPCTAYAWGQPPTWPVWDGTVRYAGLAPWDSVPLSTYLAYLDSAAAVGVRVIGFASALWATQAPTLAGLPVHPNLAGWQVAEEPSTPADVAALVPLANVLHEAGLLVWVNVFGGTSPEALAALASLAPDLVSSDDYADLPTALATDARLAAALPGVPRLVAVSTVQWTPDLPLPTAGDVAAWVAGAHSQGAGVLWFVWRAPALDQTPDGPAWQGGLWR